MNEEKLILPNEEELVRELEKEQYKQSFRKILRSTVLSLISLAAVVVLIVMLLLPVLRIYGTSMEPTLVEGEIVTAIKGSELRRGDIVAFYYENKVLVKRYIAGPGEWVNIDEEGNVYVDGEYLEEPYLTEKAFGDCNIELPYQVPEEKYFLLGDHRATALDSRNTALGCVDREQMIGKLIFSVWPFERIGPLNELAEAGIGPIIQETYQGLADSFREYSDRVQERVGPFFRRDNQ